MLVAHHRALRVLAVVTDAGDVLRADAMEREVNGPWPEIRDLLVTVIQWEALRKTGSIWKRTNDLTRAQLLDPEQTHGRHPLDRPMG